VPLSVRVLPWGGESLTLALAKLPGTSQDQAEQLKLQSGQPAAVQVVGRASRLPPGRLALDPTGAGGSPRMAGETPAPPPEPSTQPGPAGAALATKIQAALETAVDSLARVINGNWNGQKVYLAGRSAQLKDFAPQLARCLGNGTRCQLLELDSGEGRSAAVLGLRTVLANGSESALVTLQSEPANGGAALTHPASWKWAGVALGLALACLAVPYLEPLVLKSRLSRKLTAIQSDRARLVTIDRELDFLRHLKQNRPTEDALVELP